MAGMIYFATETGLAPSIWQHFRWHWKIFARVEILGLCWLHLDTVNGKTGQWRGLDADGTFLSGGGKCQQGTGHDEGDVGFHFH